MQVAADVQWVLNSDRGLSYDDTVPEGSTIVDGTWWGKDYHGPPLVSFESEIAKKLGVGLGDRVTVNVLGRNIEATIANLREVKWESLALNFIMVFSPNTLEAAPHNLLATVRLPPGTAPSVEADMVRDLGRAYPSVSAIRVRDAIDRFAKIFAKVMVAVQVAGSVTLAAGALVLAGALATAQRRRILEAVILKTIGARRRQILKAHAYEYALLAAIAAFVAVALGSVDRLGCGDPLDGDRLRLLCRSRIKDAGAGGGHDHRIRGHRHLVDPAGAGRPLSPFRIGKLTLFCEGLESEPAEDHISREPADLRRLTRGFEDTWLKFLRDRPAL